MAKYKVLTPVERNQTLYWPEAEKGPKTSPSFGNGQPISVDTTGTIELSDADAKQLLVGGAIAPAKAAAKK
jgi:hypothetical protein